AATAGDMERPAGRGAHRRCGTINGGGVSLSPAPGIAARRSVISSLPRLVLAWREVGSSGTRRPPTALASDLLSSAPFLSVAELMPIAPESEELVIAVAGQRASHSAACCIGTLELSSLTNAPDAHSKKSKCRV